jgi:nucleoside-diphosphate-sugar epimerase
MKILVTGASGHVGGAIASHLAAQGHEVFAVDYRAASVEDLAGQVTLDLTDDDFLARLTGEIPACDAIVHAAASLDKNLLSESVIPVNCQGTQRIIAAAEAFKARHLVYISGVTVIGRPATLPITEEHVTHPASAYVATKLFGEHLTRLAGETLPDLAATSLRLTAPVGPGMPRNRILSVFVQRALAGEPLRLLGKGLRRQDYVDVRDVACAVEACLAKSASGLFNIAASQAISNVELAQTCLRCLGSTSPIEFTGAPDREEDIVWDVSIEKAHKVFGYTPGFTFEDSIHAVAESHANRNHQ